MNKKICIIQVNYTDLSNYNTDYNCINVIKESELFSNIVLAAPDIKENEVLIDFAKTNGIECFLGNVNNVAKRMLDCCEKFNSDIAIRVLLNWFFIDLKLLKDMIETLENTNSDYVNVPRNFDIRFAADVFNVDFLEKILKYSNSEKNNFKMLFNPWGYADANPEKFSITTIKNVPEYTNKYYKQLKRLFKIVWPERHNNSMCISTPYHIAEIYLKNKKINRVLDIACGLGDGSNHLAAFCNEVIAIDMDENTIIENIKNNHNNNIKYKVGDAEKIEFNEGEFNAIVSIHTLEHLYDDDGFINKCHTFLTCKGLLIIEVPLHRDYPLKQIISEYHIREYKTESFLFLLKKTFDIIEVFGVSRGFYVKKENAREAIMVVCEKR